MMNCSKVHDLLSSYYDEELPVDTRREVESHLEDCRDCSDELEAFTELTSLAASLAQPTTPDSVWSGIRESLEHSDQIVSVGSNSRWWPSQRIRQIAAVAAIILIGIVGANLWHGGQEHKHEEMAHAMQQIAAEIDSDETPTLLLNQFGGQIVSADDATKLVGYEPIAGVGLPNGYRVESMQVLDMPCCKCLQTACRRPDDSRLFIFEHDNDDTGWFEGRDRRQAECCGKSCEVVDLDSSLAVTWRKDGRHVTLLGIQDDEELELLVSAFENNS